jgi:hypothetical protein
MLLSTMRYCELVQKNMKKIRLKLVEIAKRYLSGKLIVVQFLGGCSAFIFRTAVAYFTTYKFHLSVWDTALFYTIASNFGYIATWFIGYFIAFRKDYYKLKRPIWPDMLRLQLIEQAPNLITLEPSALSGWALTSKIGISPLASTKYYLMVWPPENTQSVCWFH